ncbi:peroxisomal ATPase PEX6-like isoform X1 [Paramacrobiotus metropolitanus]|uniref:peroxisomal ATPase PEX6-like isoform X1 n=1 Tax=Paramacrobiotus metropolitanus TaxID=2943436 RepID=UPI00244597FC|nr:peroxisomal ATPase PEX6-like isoform X1 [Paramacrobiotus metropolitanus]XP_055353343.1 peroxisomal ATPase PEX6-like isoform X1 [Paramacrobiotus metropolitanus]XP_055353344.1 peroxisomal ATPase PEX6-like isoform X1 [Paramacrobiotus metropolitanus]XP_055353345.1 peroxisomal ATPase PEX6-like isoform X1 [Paramacrobiotus metropolitanus]
MIELRAFKTTFMEQHGSKIDGSQTLRVSPLVWFNWNGASAHRLHDTVRVNAVAEHEQPKHFQTARFSCVRSSGNLDGAERWYPHLKSLFETPRLLKKGDTVCCNVSHYLPVMQRGSDIIYFRLVDTEPETMVHGLVEVDKTFLFIVGFMGSYVPLAMEHFYSDHPQKPLKHTVAELGLEKDLTTLLEVLRTFSSKNLKNPPTVSVLLSGEPACGKRILCYTAALRLHMQVFEINVVRDTFADTIAATESRIQHKFEKASLCAPCVILLSHLEFFRKSKHEPRLWQALHRAIKDATCAKRDYPVIVIGTCIGPPSHELEDLFSVILEVKGLVTSRVPSLNRSLAGSLHNAAAELNYDGLVSASHHWDFGDVISLLESAEFQAYSRCVDQRNTQEQSRSLKQADFMNGLHEQEAAFGQHFQLKTPVTTWTDIGGLEDAKLELLRLIELPMRCQQIVDSGLQRFGVLLCGPPGNGKTLLAKAVANQCSLNFISVKGPELINMYVGQSEENIRTTFDRARKTAPSLIFFDELDSIVPARGRTGDSGGVIDRVVSQMMTEMDGLTRHTQVFVLGATNRPDLIDPALLRPGRFDRIIQIGNPTTSKHRLQILKAITRKCSLDKSDLLEHVERRLESDISGADIYAVCADAALFAMQRLVSSGITDAELVITNDDFDKAIERSLCTQNVNVTKG